jgi:hypothetical protein
MRTPFGNLSRESRLGGIKAKLRPAALRIRLGFAAALLVRGLKRSQPTHFLKNSFGVEFVLQAFQRPVNRFTFANNHFRHVSSSFLKISGFEPVSPSLLVWLAGVNYCE